VNDLMLRAATNRDGQAVTELVVNVLTEYGLPPDPGATDADLSDLEGYYAGGAFAVLVDANGVLLGCVGLGAIDSTTCDLRKMYLRKDVRGQGLGRRLLEHALDRARTLGFERVTLETASVLTDAVRLYTWYGFKPYPTAHLSCRCDQAYILDLRVTQPPECDGDAALSGPRPPL
jgi:GNAT superfamily N-acetyltransferase